MLLPVSSRRFHRCSTRTERPTEMMMREDETSAAQSGDPTTTARSPEQEKYVYGAYRVISVEKLANRDSGQTGDWCRYVIGSGASRVTGIHRGNVSEVTEYAENTSQDFNERNRLHKGKLTAWQPNKKK